MTFNDLEFGPKGHDKLGKQAKVKFPNGWGASIIIGPYTYGGKDGLYELAVLDKNGHLDYSTPVTSAAEGRNDMTQPALAFDAGPDTFLDAVVDLFKRRPNEWIDGLEIAKVGGVYAYRTRISEARTQRGMDIQNRVRRLPGKSTRVSEYIYRP